MKRVHPYPLFALRPPRATVLHAFAQHAGCVSLARGVGSPNLGSMFPQYVLLQKLGRSEHFTAVQARVQVITVVP